MKIIGITGGTGSGKTTALNALLGLDARIIDADQVYHRLTETSQEMRAEMRARFGAAIDREDGSLDRKRLGEIVFQNPKALEDLNEITHRYVGEEIDCIIEAARREGRGLLAIDAIELIESGLREKCDITVAVVAPEGLRIRRIMEREGISEDYAKKRVRAQKDEAYFRANCDYVLESCEEDEVDTFSARALALFKKLLEEHSEGGRTDMKEVRKPGEVARESLLLSKKNGYDRVPTEDEEKINVYCEAYKDFLNKGKTERACVTTIVSLAEAHGFQPLVRGETLKAGDRRYRVNRDKGLMMAVIGSESMEQGSRICAAHIDSPRLDLKQHPLYEDKELAYFKTHYYGGIRKHQWTSIPLELHGVVILKDGSSRAVSIGASPSDPVFTITDLLPHLAAEQSKKPLGEAIAGEQLKLLVGSRPFKDDEGSERVKLSILALLHEKYGMIEEDFLSAELMAVPATPARDVGLDRSMIGGYGQDDRVCAFAGLWALLEAQNLEHTAILILADKEEVGSMGVTGMKSAAFDTFMGELCDAQGASAAICYEKSFCLSADVTAAYDPNYPEVYEKQNSAYLNYGICLSKYTGSRGKAGASDASAETVGFVRKLLNDGNIVWQTAELGKTDQGGGGTVAAYMADRNIDTLDAGVPVLSMHAPFEVVSKLDCYMTYEAIKRIYAS